MYFFLYSDWWFCLIVTKLEYFEEILLQVPIIVFYDSVLSLSPAIPHGRTDGWETDKRTDMTIAFRNVTNTPKN